MRSVSHVLSLTIYVLKRPMIGNYKHHSSYNVVNKIIIKITVIIIIIILTYLFICHHNCTEIRCELPTMYNVTAEPNHNHVSLSDIHCFTDHMNKNATLFFKCFLYKLLLLHCMCVHSFYIQLFNT